MLKRPANDNKDPANFRRQQERDEHGARVNQQIALVVMVGAAVVAVLMFLKVI